MTTETVEYIMKDRQTDMVGRYQFVYDDYDELMNALDLDMLLTVEEMAVCTLNELTQQDRDDMKALNKTELIQLHHSSGEDIRNAFGLWIDGNPNVPNHADDTSMEVLELMWDKLQNSGSGIGSETMEFI